LGNFQENSKSKQSPIRRNFAQSGHPGGCFKTFFVAASNDSSFQLESQEKEANVLDIENRT
jgi:hypothetical protein